MSISQQGQTPVRELSAQEVRNYFYPRPTPMWNIGAIVFGAVLIPLSIFLHFILLAVAGPIVAAIFGFIVYRRIKSHPDDESYDAWVKGQARELYERSLDVLDIQPGFQGQKLIIRSLVLPGSSAANEYQSGEALMKWGKDGRLRFSINVYTFIFCTTRFIAIFESDINVFHPFFHTDTHNIYAYSKIFSAMTTQFEDTVLLNEQEVPYRMEQFCLELTNGDTVILTATVRARPRGNVPGASVIIPPGPNFDKKLSKLRQILLDHQ